MMMNEGKLKLKTIFVWYNVTWSNIRQNSNITQALTRPAAQIPQCTSSISHNAPFCNRNVRVCTFLLQNAFWDICLVHCGIYDMGLLLCTRIPIALKKKPYLLWGVFLTHCGLMTPYGDRSGSTLAQLMACCLMAPSHYLNQCWLIISEVQWHSY